jgi:hypothetical protein
VLICSPEEAYALTHTLFYYYQFGVAHAAPAPEPLAYDLSDTLTALILRFLVDEEAIYQRRTDTMGDFEEEIRRPIDEICAKLHAKHIAFNALGQARNAPT